VNRLVFVTKPSSRAQAVERRLRPLLEGLPAALAEPLVVAVGGDGTMLHAIREHLDERALFVGVSAGTLGFLQTVEPDRLEALAAALRSGAYGVIEAPLLTVREAAGGGRVLGRAFNDVVVERRGARAARFGLHVGGSAGGFIGDGVIFATPLGSTAYSLAAGGPIIDSNVQDVFVVTPSNPHLSALYSSLQRPHVLGRGRRVRISVAAADAEERPVKLTADGFELADNVRTDVEIYLSERKVRLIELEPDGFRSRIEDKRLGRS